MNLRDGTQTSEYYEKSLNRYSEMVDRGLNRVSDESIEADRREGFAAALTRNSYELALMMYSSGHPIEQCAARMKTTLTEYLPLESQVMTVKDFTGGIGQSRVLRYLSALVLSKPEPEQSVAVAEEFLKWGYESWAVYPDKIVNSFYRHLGADVEVDDADGVGWPELYSDLWQAIDPSTPDTGRARSLACFVEGWYGHVSEELVAETPRLKNNNVVAYVGHWCLEAAGAAVAFDIDDSAIREHPHYPTEWADWARE